MRLSQSHFCWLPTSIRLHQSYWLNSLHLPTPSFNSLSAEALLYVVLRLTQGQRRC